MFIMGEGSVFCGLTLWRLCVLLFSILSCYVMLSANKKIYANKTIDIMLRLSKCLLFSDHF